MRSLLDVNVLLALFDETHLHHRAATAWLEVHLGQGWATCPITQNGCLRILSQPAYPNAQPSAVVAQRLRKATADRSHEFWADSLSLVDAGRLRWDRVLTPRQVTDAYLLALAVSHGGRLITFDRGIPIAAVPGAATKHLLILGGAA